MRRVPFALLMICVVASACTRPATADEVRSRMTAALYAWNGRDYAGWTERWSPELLADGSEAEWRAARDRGIAVSGPFVAIAALRSESLAGGRTRWVATCEFEEATLAFTLVLRDTDGLVLAVSLGAIGAQSASTAASSRSVATAWSVPHGKTIGAP